MRVYFSHQLSLAMHRIVAISALNSHKGGGLCHIGIDLFGARSNIHIMDLSQTVPLLHQALVQAREVAAKGGRVLFVGTKRAASEPVANSAKRCAQYYVNHRKF